MVVQKDRHVVVKLEVLYCSQKSDQLFRVFYHFIFVLFLAVVRKNMSFLYFLLLFL